MARPFFQAALAALFTAGFVGCARTPADAPAERIEEKKAEWRQKQVEAEERFADLAQTLPPSRRAQLSRELQAEFESGRRSLENSSLR